MSKNISRSRYIKPCPTQKILKQAFDYHEDGLLIWRRREPESSSDKTFNSRYSGKVAGSIAADGYVVVSIYGESFKAHRLIWIWHYGSIPDGMEIDHTEGMAMGDRIEFLSCKTPAQNNRNACRRVDNTTGHCGVTWSRSAQKWMARVTFDGTRFYLGCFSEIEEAASAVKRFRSERDFSAHHGELNAGRKSNHRRFAESPSESPA